MKSKKIIIKILILVIIVILIGIGMAINEEFAKICKSIFKAFILIVRFPFDAIINSITPN